MKPQSFIHNAITGLIISAIASGGYQILRLGFEPYSASSSAIILAASLFIIFLFNPKPSEETSKKGQVTLLFTFFASAVLMLLMAPPISVVIILSLLWIWLARSWHCHKSLLVAMVDLALCGFSLSIAISAGAYSQSTFMAFWSFFLTQSMIVPSIEYCRNQLRKDPSLGLSELNLEQEITQAIMPGLTLSSASISDGLDDMERFKQAHQIAEQSLDRLLASEKSTHY